MADDNTAEAAGGDLAALRRVSRTLREHDGPVDPKYARTLASLIDQALAAAPASDAVPRLPHFDPDAPAGSSRWISDRVEDIVGGDCGMADAIGDALSDDLAPHLAAAPASEAEGGDRWITSAAAANRLPTGTVVETDAGHRGIVTEHGHGRYLMWSSGPEKSWRACVLFVATPRAEGEAAAGEPLSRVVHELRSTPRDWLIGRRAHLADIVAAHRCAPPAPEVEAVTAAWSQHFDDTAAYAGGFTDPERAGIRAAARMMRDVDVRARVHSTIGGDS